MNSILNALGDRRVALRDENEKQKGFTLIELLVVVIIIGILAAIAIPVFLSQRESAWGAAVESDIKNEQIRLETFATNSNGSYATYLHDDTTESEGVDLAVVVDATTGNSYTITGTHDDRDGSWVYSSATGQTVFTP